MAEILEADTNGRVPGSTFQLGISRSLFLPQPFADDYPRLARESDPFVKIRYGRVRLADHQLELRDVAIAQPVFRGIHHPAADTLSACGNLLDPTFPK